MYAILYWEDSTFSVVGLISILSPRKEVNEYEIGDLVQAKFQGKVYSAKIYEIGENRASLNKSLSSGFKIDFFLSIIEPSTCAKHMRHSSAPEEAANRETEGPTKRKRQFSDTSKRYSSAPEEAANGEMKGPTKKRRHSDENDVQTSDSLVEQARQILIKRRLIANKETLTPVTPPPVTTPPVISSALTPPPVIPEAFTPPPVIQTALKHQPVIPAASMPPPVTAAAMTPPPVISAALTPTPVNVLALTQPPVIPAALTSTPVIPATFSPPPVIPAALTPPIVIPTALTPTAVTLAPETPLEYGVPPPGARTVPFLEMMAEPLHDDEVQVTQQSNGFVSCHSCCQLIEQLHARVTQLEFEVQQRRHSPAIMSSPTTTPLCSTPPRRPVVATAPAREPLLTSSHNITVGNNQTLQQTIQAEIQHETRLSKAITRCMLLMFTNQQLATCSFKGAPTTTGTPRTGLPNAERNAIIDVIANKFDMSLVEVEDKMRGALRRLRAMYKED